MRFWQFTDRKLMRILATVCGVARVFTTPDRRIVRRLFRSVGARITQSDLVSFTAIIPTYLGHRTPQIAGRRSVPLRRVYVFGF
jgi:hypothetical protein